MEWWKTKNRENNKKQEEEGEIGRTEELKTQEIWVSGLASATGNPVGCPTHHLPVSVCGGDLGVVHPAARTSFEASSPGLALASFLYGVIQQAVYTFCSDSHQMTGTCNPAWLLWCPVVASMGGTLMDPIMTTKPLQVSPRENSPELHFYDSTLTSEQVWKGYTV